MQWRGGVFNEQERARQSIYTAKKVVHFLGTQRTQCARGRPRPDRTRLVHKPSSTLLPICLGHVMINGHTSYSSLGSTRYGCPHAYESYNCGEW